MLSPACLPTCPLSLTCFLTHTLSSPQVGNTTEGGLGPGWIQDTQGEDEFPYDPRLVEAMAGDVEDDKLEESEDKEMILGDDMLNPFTGEREV